MRHTWVTEEPDAPPERGVIPSAWTAAPAPGPSVGEPEAPAESP
jgi:hypothetical protein